MAPNSEVKQGKHLGAKRVLAHIARIFAWSVSAFFCAVLVSCAIELNSDLRQVIYGPDHVATFTLEPEQVTVSVELMNSSPIGKAEFDRRLIVALPDKTTVATSLFSDHGGFASTNLYRTADGNFVLAGSFDAELITFTPLSIKPYNESYLSNRDKGHYQNVAPSLSDTDRNHLGELKESNYFRGLFYIGAFAFKDKQTDDKRKATLWTFLPAGESIEVIKDPGG